MPTLADLSTGSLATVTNVTATDPASQRLLELGVTPGVKLRLVGTAPLGDRLEIELRGYRLSVRRSEAAVVEVSLS